MKNQDKSYPAKHKEKEHIHNGNVTISTPGVTLQNTIISGNLYLTEGIGEGEVKLKNVTVKGSTLVRGGGAHSLVLEDCTLPSITVSKEGVRVVASGNTTVRVIRLESGANLVEVSSTGPGFETVTVSEAVPANTSVTLQGSFATVNVDAAEVKVDVAAGTVAKLDVAKEAAGVTLNIAKDASVTTLTLDSAVKVTGQGTIDKAVVNVNGSSIEQTPQSVVTANGTTVTVGNKEVTQTTTNTTTSGSGSGGGGGASNHPPAAKPVGDQSLSVGGGPLTLTGSQLATDPDGDALTVTKATYGAAGVVSLNWSTGSLVISPVSAGTTSVTASVYDNTNQGVTVTFSVAVTEIANAFNVTSSGFTANGEIPDKYSFGGGNKSIPLAWSAGPAGTLSYALVMYDPDANDFIHWMVKNIPANITSLAEAASGATMPAGSVELPNTNFMPGYFGPSPPARHKYVTKIYALNVATLDALADNPFPPYTLADFNNAIQGKVLASGELLGFFTPNQSSANIAYSAATYDNQTFTEGQAIGNLDIEVKDVKNWSAQAVSASTTVLTGNVALKLNDTNIPANSGGVTYWSLDDSTDTITVTQDYLDTVSDGWHYLHVKIKDATNNIINASGSVSVTVNQFAPTGTPGTISLKVISGSPVLKDGPIGQVVIDLTEYDDDGNAVEADLNGVTVEDDWGFLSTLVLNQDYTIDDAADRITLTTDYLNYLSLGTNTTKVTLANGKSADVDVMAGNGLGLLGFAYELFAAGGATSSMVIPLVQYDFNGEKIPASVSVLSGATLADGNGDLILDQDYTINDDNDRITLTTDYLNTLPAGTTMITITLLNGMSRKVDIDVL